MEQCKMFGNAVWVGAGSYDDPSAKTLDSSGTPNFPILRSTFSADRTRVKKAVLRVLGLGFFHCRINGRTVTEDQFLPLNTDYEPRKNYPVDETVTGHRIYVPVFDVTDCLRDGKNVLTLHFGGGWYTYQDTGSYTMPNACFGTPKAIFRLTLETEDGDVEIVSSTQDKIGDSFVKTYHLTAFEAQDYIGFDDAVFFTDYNDSAWQDAQPALPPDTDYLLCDCPADRVEKMIQPVCTKRNGEEAYYDCGQNLTGYPILKIKAAKGETVSVIFAEEKNEDGSPDRNFHYGQTFSVVSDGTERIVSPQFTWFAFRYFSVKGDAEVTGVPFVHTDVKVTSAFDSDNETLNWLYRAYLNTQLCNMHAGIPSDCPHIERRGYTGDGQLTCHAVMDTMDAQKFYRKWIDDIADCQDIYSGHVQYTAPYTRCGGGPGGWGCAIIEVPYTYYKHYGDAGPLFKYYAQMLRYFDYLDAHSRNDLVESDKAGEWCLGDWCAPIQVILPAAFVNNYFYIKSLMRMKEIAEIVGRTCDIPMFDEKIEARKKAVTAAYFNTWDGNFIGGLQGANAFAIDMGLGNEQTYRNLVTYYQTLGHFDTGIFGTDIVTRVLFAHGDGALAVRLLASTDPISFDGMRQAGATTIWENWPHATWDRSRNHPMFGAVTAYLFDYLLGIQADHGVEGYRAIVVAPVMVDLLERVSGKRTLPKGEVCVSYEKKDGKVVFHVTLPADLPAKFLWKDKEIVLGAGENVLEFIL